MKMSALKICHYHSNVIRKCFTVRCIQFSSIIFNISPKKRFCTDSKFGITNPLFEINELPDYNRITGDVVENSLPVILQELENNFKEFEDSLKESEVNYTWDNVIAQPELMSDKFGLAWSAVSHLNSVRNNPSLRSAYEKVQPLVVTLSNKLSQSKPVFEALNYLISEGKILDGAQRRIIESSIRDARNSGVHLEGTEKEEFNHLSQKLAELSMKFMNNVLDSTKQFSYLIYDKKEVEELPESLQNMMASSASKELNLNVDPSVGPWKLSLDMPCFQPFMMYSENQSLRKMLYLAYVSRAGSGELDNSEIIEVIRGLRKKKSLLLGYENYSFLSLEKKMAKNPSAVWKMIEDLRDKSKVMAEKELSMLTEYALNHGHVGELKQWDLAFWSEHQKESLFNFKEEALREYFPLERVLHGLFLLCEELFGIKFSEVKNGSVETWHKDVRFFHVYNLNGTHISSFFLDPYARPQEKQGGAWHNSALDRNYAIGRKPVSYLICNQRPPVGNVPSLMSFNEVRTLFHEFGHGLQHMLTEVKYPAAAGINNIEWDAVELPSQFMENWLYDWSTIKQISSHYITGESLPMYFYEQLQKAKKYQAGMANLRQLYFAALDMELHSSDDKWETIMDRISENYTILKPHKEDKFPCSFLHIFAGGYAAGYYSYKWAEVLSADTFSSFQEAGLDNRDEIILLGKKFRSTILAMGGSVHPEDNFIAFKGRKANVNALLESYGIS